MLSSMFLVTALGIMQKTNQIYNDSYEKAGEADIIYGFNKQLYKTEYLTYFEEKEYVEQTTVENALLGNLNPDGEDDIPTIFSSYETMDRDYQLTSKITELKKQQIILPLNFKDEFNLDVGDTISYNNIDFEIASFFEDPIYGSPFYHTKRVLVSEDMLNDLSANISENKLHELHFINVNLSDGLTNTEVSEYSKTLNDDFAGLETSAFSFEKTNLETVRTIVPRIVLAVLLVFSLFLLVIMVIVIRYTILASIEDDYTSFGVMKALGFKNRNITFLLLIQYLSVVLLGSVLGVVGAYIIAPPIGSYLLSTSGILWVGNIDVLVTIILVASLLLFVGVIVLLQTKQVKKVKPIEAIVTGKRGFGKETNIVSLTDGTIFSKLPLSIRLGVKQLISGLRQYMSLLILIVIFSFMILTVLSLSNAFGTPENVSSILGYEINDIHVEITDEENLSDSEIENIFDQLDENYQITYFTSFDSRYTAYVDNYQTQLLVNSDIEETNLIDGRLPKDANEIVISNGTKDSLEKGIGDSISISIEKDGKAESYEIVGINNKVYNMGSNITMLDTGIEMLVENYSPLEYYVKIDDSTQIHNAITDIKKQYTSKSDSLNVTNEREAMMKRIIAIQNVFEVLSNVVVIISLALIALITLLVAIVITKREVFNFGIMKSIGFTSRQIRTQVTLRFAFIAIIASILGISLYLISNNNLINLLFSVVNIAQIPSGTNAISYLFSTFFILFTTALCTWLVSKNVKTVKVRDLIKD